MRRNPTVLRRLLQASALTMLLATPALADPKLQIFGLTADQHLLRFREDRALTNRDLGPISGLTGDSRLVGIDFRPANGVLYAIGDQGGIYTLDLEHADATFRVQTSLNGAPLALSGTSFGVDFNPTVDRLRAVSDSGQNLRINVDTGVAIADGALNFPGVAPAPATPALGVTGVAYTNNDLDPATATTLFDLDTSADQVEIQLPPNAGSLSPTGKFGAALDSGLDTGFDIWSDTKDGRTISVRAFAALSTNGSRLYEIDLLTGLAKQRGRFRSDQQVIGIAIPLD